MGNLLSLARESKAFMQEIPRILAAFIEVLFGMTRMLQDLEEIFIELKIVSDLLEVGKSIERKNEQAIMQRKAANLLKRTKTKLYNIALKDSKYNGVLKNIELVIENLLDSNKCRQTYAQAHLDSWIPEK